MKRDGDWWSAPAPAPRRRTEADDSEADLEPDPSASQRLAKVETQIAWVRRWAIRGAMALVSVALGGAGAYYKDWKASTARAAVAEFRAEMAERQIAATRAELDALRTSLFGLLLFPRNPSALPAPGDFP